MNEKFYNVDFPHAILPVLSIILNQCQFAITDLDPRKILHEFSSSIFLSRTNFEKTVDFNDEIFIENFLSDKISNSSC